MESGRAELTSKRLSDYGLLLWQRQVVFWGGVRVAGRKVGKVEEKAFIRLPLPSLPRAAVLSFPSDL